MVMFLWAMKFALLVFVLTIGIYLTGFVLVGVTVLVWRHYHICRHDELSADFEWHQYALIWPLLFAQMVVLAPKDIRRLARRWQRRCQDFWAGLTSS